MKTTKRIILAILLIAVAVSVNLAYYLFYGQSKSMDKLRADKELNLYECCSIYSIHIAACTFGWLLSPEAADQCVLMMFAKNDSWHFRKTHFMRSDYIQRQALVRDYKNFRLDFPLNDITSSKSSPLRSELRYALAYDGATYVHNDMENEDELRLDVCYDAYTANYNVGIFDVTFYWQLLNYIQNRGWLSKVHIIYTNY